MNSNRNVYTLALALLGAAKLVTDAYGLRLFDDAQMDAIANGIATLATVAGVVMTHVKRPTAQAS